MRIGSVLFAKLLFDEVVETIFFIVATNRLVLCAFTYEFNCCYHLKILGCLLAVMGRLREKSTFHFWFCGGRTISVLFSSLHFLVQWTADKLVAGIFPTKIVIKLSTVIGYIQRF